MAKSVAILIDGTFAMEKMKSAKGTSVSPKDLYQFALSCINPNEEIFRIFFYHCAPYDGIETHPITQKQTNYATTAVARYNNSIINDLSQMDYIAIRKGHLAFRGWAISKFATKQLQQHMLSQQQLAATSQSTSSQATSSQPNYNVVANDFEPTFIQKEVDIKIGLDVAWMSTRHIVDKIMLITGDTDLVPAMKFARREGVQVVIVSVLSGPNDYLHNQLKEHADEIRKIRFDSKSGNWNVV